MWQRRGENLCLNLGEGKIQMKQEEKIDDSIVDVASRQRTETETTHS